MSINRENIKKEILKLFSFACTGIVSAAVDCTVYYILLHFASIDFRLIQPISMTVGLLCSFVVNRGVVFRKERASLGKEAVKYMIVCIVCISVSPIIISFYHLWLGEYLVKIPATLTTGLLNYVLNRFFVYKDVSFYSLKNRKRND